MIDLNEFEMRAPCSTCGETAGRVVTKNGQDTVRCKACDKYAGYNLPKRESGKPQRSIRSRKAFSPSERAAILLRDGFQCVLCRRTESTAILNIGHLISVDVGLRIGMTEDEVNDDENLAAMCEECNSGLSEQPIPLPTAVWIVRARISWRNSKDGAS